MPTVFPCVLYHARKPLRSIVSIFLLIGVSWVPGAVTLDFESQWAGAPLYEETVPNSSGFWHLPNVAPGVDATLTLVGFYGNGGEIATVEVDGFGSFRRVYGETTLAAPYPSALAISFTGVDTTHAGAVFRLDFSVPISTTLAILDLDNQAGLQEAVGFEASAITGYSLGSHLTDLGETDGVRWIGGSTLLGDAEVSVQDAVGQAPITASIAIGETTSLTFSWEFTRDIADTNTRTFFLASVPEPESLPLGIGVVLGVLSLSRRRRLSDAPRRFR